MEKNPDSLIVKMVNGDLSKIEARTVIDAAREGDKVACEVYDKYIYYLAIGIVAIINAFDPEIIALGGGVSKAGDFLLKPLREKVAKYVFYKDLPMPRSRSPRSAATRASSARHAGQVSGKPQIRRRRAFHRINLSWIL